MTFALLFLGGVGIILIFRDRGWHIAGALVAALAFVFGCSECGAAAASEPDRKPGLSAAGAVAARCARWSVRHGGGALALALRSALIGIGRDDVALLALYVLTGFVIWHWLDGEGRWQRLRASTKPLAATGVVVLLLLAVPLLLTMLPARRVQPPGDRLRLRRPRIAPSRASADAGVRRSLRRVRSVCRLLGTAEFSVAHCTRADQPVLAQNMGQIYAGALVVVTIVSFGILRGIAWSRDIRFFTIAAVLMLLFALGWYTPAFRVMYEVLPGVSLFRRPAGATFVFGAMIAVMAGYLVHRWLTASVPPPRPYQGVLECVFGAGVVVIAAALALSGRHAARGCHSRCHRHPLRRRRDRRAGTGAAVRVPADRGGHRAGRLHDRRPCLEQRAVGINRPAAAVDLRRAAP